MGYSLGGEKYMGSLTKEFLLYLTMIVIDKRLEDCGLLTAERCVYNNTSCTVKSSCFHPLQYPHLHTSPTHSLHTPHVHTRDSLPTHNNHQTANMQYTNILTMVFSALTLFSGVAAVGERNCILGGISCEYELGMTSPPLHHFLTSLHLCFRGSAPARDDG